MPRTMWALWAALSLSNGFAIAQETADTTPETEEEAKALFRNGVQLYEEGDYEAAAEAFQMAYDLSGRSALLLNLANAHERLGRFDQAIDALTRYRLGADESEQIALARRITHLERRRDEETASALQLAQQQAEQERLKAEVAAAQAQAAQAELQARMAAADTGRRAAGASKGLKLGLGVTGGALVAGFTTTAALTWAGSDGWIDAGDQQTYETMRTLHIGSWIGAGVGAALLTTAIALPGRKAPEAALSFNPTVDGGTVAWRMAW